MDRHYNTYIFLEYVGLGAYSVCVGGGANGTVASPRLSKRKFKKEKKREKRKKVKMGTYAKMYSSFRSFGSSVGGQTPPPPPSLVSEQISC